MTTPRPRAVAVLRSPPTGVALAALWAAWVAFSASQHDDARPGPVFALLLAAAAATLVGAALARVAWWVPVLIVAIATAAATAPFWAEAGEPLADPLGYGNANGTLFAIGAIASMGLSLASPPVPARVVGGITAAILTTAVVMSESAASLAVLGLGLLVLAVALHHAWFGTALAALAIAGAATCTIGLATFAEGDVEGSALGVRVALWHHALELAHDEPITGVGPGRFADERTLTDDPDLAWAHHGGLQVAAETGLVGLGLLAAIVAWAIGWGHRAGPPGAVALATGAALLAHSSVDYVLHEGVLTAAVACLLGACASARGRASEPRPLERTEP